MQKEEKYEGAELRSPFFKWWDNFWYHYKWHSLIALFLVLALTICTVQMCTKEDYDLHVMYAGAADVKKTSDSGLSEYAILLSSLKLAMEDYDEDGSVSVDLQTLFLPSEEEILEIEQTLPEGYAVQTQLVMDNGKHLQSQMLLSDYYLCFLSEANYLSYRDRTKGFFAPLTPYVGSAEVTYYEGRTDAVYLSSTTFGKIAGWSQLPENTLICLRSVSEVAERADSKNSKKQFERAEQTLRNLFATVTEAQS